MNTTAAYALALILIGAPVAVGTVAYLACRLVNRHADQYARDTAAAARHAARKGIAR